MTAVVEVKDFTSERGPTVKMAVAAFPNGIEVFPVFQPNLARSWGMQRDRVPMHFTYQLEGGDITDVDDKYCRQDSSEIDEYLERFRKEHPDLEVVGMTGNGNVRKRIVSDQGTRAFIRRW
jgi:hypothetical protein